MHSYPRAEKYPDLELIYSQCSGPGALRTAEFVADKLALRPDMRVLDIGIFRGLQTCVDGPAHRWRSARPGWSASPNRWRPP